MSLDTVEEFDSINKRINETLAKNDYDKFLDFIELVKAEESKMDTTEEIISDLRNLFKIDSINVENQGIRKSLGRLSKAMKSLSNLHVKTVEFIRENDIVNVIEAISPKLVSRMESVIEDLEDVAENIDLSLNCTKELKKLEKLATDYSIKVEPVSMEKWVEET